MKRKIKIIPVLVLFIIIISLITIIYILNRKTSNNEVKVLMIDIVNKDINIVKEEIDKYNMDIDIKYEYNDKIKKDYIISQSIPKDMEIDDISKLEIVVSLGKLDKEKLAQDKINELGNIPIMMYHGIKDMKDSDTSYTKGNVDKDGYTRTLESFRRDLDYFYEKGYRMIKLSDYIDGNIDVEYGKSPIVLTFDDGNDNNIKVIGLDRNGNIMIDPNSAVGVLEEYKKKYPDYNVTAIFFVTNALFNQPEYNDKILKWLVDNNYEVGNHTTGHNNFTKIDEDKTEEVVGGLYSKLENILGDKYTKIIALPFGSPYNKEHKNYSHIINATYNNKTYISIGALRVGWEPELSPYNKNFDPLFMKRCRAYDNNGKDFDIEMVFNNILEKKKYISDGNVNTITTSKGNEGIIKNTDKEIILY